MQSILVDKVCLRFARDFWSEADISRRKFNGKDVCAEDTCTASEVGDAVHERVITYHANIRSMHSKSPQTCLPKKVVRPVMSCNGSTLATAFQTFAVLDRKLRKYSLAFGKTPLCRACTEFILFFSFRIKIISCEFFWNCLQF